MNIPLTLLTLAGWLTLVLSDVNAGTLYTLGVGKADVTGPVVEIGMMGYAALDQKGTGLRQRIFSRAFIVGDADATEERFVYIIADIACGDAAVRAGLLERLQKLYGGLYHRQNVAVVGTHSHSGPGRSMML
jgi:neutral ceramidase